MALRALLESSNTQSRSSRAVEDVPDRYSSVEDEPLKTASDFPGLDTSKYGCTDVETEPMNDEACILIASGTAVTENTSELISQPDETMMLRDLLFESSHIHSQSPTALHEFPTKNFFAEADEPLKNVCGLGISTDGCTDEDADPVNKEACISTSKIETSVTENIETAVSENTSELNSQANETMVLRDLLSESSHTQCLSSTALDKVPPKNFSAEDEPLTNVSDASGLGASMECCAEDEDADPVNKEACIPISKIKTAVTENTSELNTQANETMMLRDLLLDSSHTQSHTSTASDAPERNAPTDDEPLKTASELTAKPNLPLKLDKAPVSDHSYFATTGKYGMKPKMSSFIAYPRSEDMTRILLPYPRSKTSTAKKTRVSKPVKRQLPSVPSRIESAAAPVSKVITSGAPEAGSNNTSCSQSKPSNVPDPNPPTFKPINPSNNPDPNPSIFEPVKPSNNRKKVEDTSEFDKVFNESKKKMIKMERQIESLEYKLAEKTMELRTLKKKCDNTTKALKKSRNTVENSQKALFKLKLNVDMLTVKNRRLEAELEDVLKPLKPPPPKPVKVCMPTSMVGSSDLMQGNIEGDGDIVTFELGEQPDEQEGSKSASSNKTNTPVVAHSAAVVSSVSRIPRKRTHMQMNVRTSTGVHRVSVQRSIANNGTFTYSLKPNENVKLKPIAFADSCIESSMVQSASVQIDESEFQAIQTLTDEGTFAYHLLRSSSPPVSQNAGCQNDEDLKAVEVIMALDVDEKAMIVEG